MKKQNLIKLIITGCHKPFEEIWNNKNKKEKFRCGLFGKRLCPECKSKLE